MLGAGVGLGDVLDRTIIDGSLDTRTGEAWAIRAAAWLVVLILVATAPRPPQRWLIALAGAALMVVVVSLPLAGHADTQSPEGPARPHRPRPRARRRRLARRPRRAARGLLAAPDARLRPTASAATAAFSRVALPAMLVLVAAGILQGWIYLGSLTEIVSGTYGIALLSKLVLVAVIVALATRSRRAVKRLRAGGGVAGDSGA